MKAFLVESEMAATEFDAIVIGAGSVGNPTAYFLAREGFRTLVLDELSSSGQGQNKAAIGGVRATHSDPAKIRLCQQSLEIFSHWKETTGTDIGWKKGGYCFPAFDEKVETTLKGLLPVQKKFQSQHRLARRRGDPEGRLRDQRRTGCAAGRTPRTTAR